MHSKNNIPKDGVDHEVNVTHRLDWPNKNASILKSLYGKRKDFIYLRKFHKYGSYIFFFQTDVHIWLTTLLRNQKHAIEWIKRLRANKYHEMTPAIVLKCIKEREFMRYFQNKPPDVFCKKRCSWKFCKFHRKARMLESVFNKVACFQASIFF